MKTLRRTMIAIAILGGLSLENAALAQETTIVQDEVRVPHRVRIKAWCLGSTGMPSGIAVYQNGCSAVTAEEALEQAVSLANETLNCEFQPVAYEIKSTASNLFCPEPPGENPLPIAKRPGRGGAENCWKVVLKCCVRCGEPFLVTGYGRTPAEAQCRAKNEMFEILKSESLTLCGFCRVSRVNLCCQPTR